MQGLFAGEETVIHILQDCNYAKEIWLDMVHVRHPTYIF